MTGAPSSHPNNVWHPVSASPPDPEQFVIIMGPNGEHLYASYRPLTAPDWSTGYYIHPDPELNPDHQHHGWTRFLPSMWRDIHES